MFRLTAICDSCDQQLEIKELPRHPAGWEHELQQEGWGVLDDDDLCSNCLVVERDELAAARAGRVPR